MGNALPTGAVVADKVNYTDRPVRDGWAAVVFAVVFLAQIGVLAAMIVSSKGYDAWLEDGCRCSNMADCSSFSYVLKGDGLTKLIEAYPGVFVLALVLTGFLSIIWIYILQKFARAVVWATMILKIVGLIALGVLLTHYGVGSTAIIFFVLAGIGMIALYLLRKKIDLAAEVLRQAAKAIDANPFMLFGAALIVVVIVGYLMLFLFAILRSPTIGDWVPFVYNGGTSNFCTFESKSWVNAAYYFASVVFVWVMSWFGLVRLYMIGGATAFWFFHQDDNNPAKPRHAALTTIRWAFYQGAGTNVFGGAIIGLCNRLRSWGQNKCCLPVYIIMRIIGAIIEFASRFAIILSAIYGYGFMDAARQALVLLPRHFVKGIVSNGVSKNVLSLGAYVFALVVGLLSWIVVDQNDNVDPFTTKSDVYAIILYVFFAILHSMPLAGLFIMALMSSIFVDNTSAGFAFGAFTALMSHLLFRYMAEVILDTSDSIFVCLAIDKENSMRSPVTQEIVAALKEKECPEFSNWNLQNTTATVIVPMPAQQGVEMLPMGQPVAVGHQQAYMAQPMGQPMSQPMMMQQQQPMMMQPQMMQAPQDPSATQWQTRGAAPLSPGGAMPRV